MLIQRTVRLLIGVLLLIPFALTAQVTSSSISGIVRSGTGEGLLGATITATHVPTGTVYSVASRTGGRYNLYNLNPGGPYRIVVTYVGYENQTREDIQLTLGENSTQDFNMSDQASTLTEVVVATTRRGSNAKGGSETTISRSKMANLPSVGRNLNDYIRLTPQVKITANGGFSLAGQNNRYNSFLIDGAVNNDVFGLSESGTNGGRSGAPPISIDAIDQIVVQLSPYDASLGNFTGGGINAITKSGTNEVQGSLYYVYRNEDLVGKSPTPLLKPGTTNVFERQKLTPFENKTFGFRVGGPIVENKLFYFVNFERQDDNRPQPFDPQSYRGNYVKNDSITVLRNFLRDRYGYELGDYVNNPDQIKATRIASKIDWNIDKMNQLSVSYRYNKAERTNPSRSSTSAINFVSGAEYFPSTTHSGTVELNSRFKSRVSNKLRVTYTDVVDDRDITGNPFPNVAIRDASGSNIFFGSEASSTANLLKQSVLNIYDAVRVNAGIHSFTLGTDIDYNKTYNLFINRNFGAYEFANMESFITGGSPIRYRRGYSLVDETGKAGDESVNSAAQFRTVRIGFFVNDDIKVNQNFTLTLGLRADRTEFLDRPAVDPFWRDTASAIVGQYYDLKGAQSGSLFQPRWLVSPRIGFTARFPEENLTLRGGLGLFAGRIPLVWPGGGFQNTGVTIGAIDIARRVSGVDQPIQFPDGTPVPFQGNVANQYNAADFGATKITPQGELNLVARNFKLPQVLRTSFGVEKRLGEGWSVNFDAIFTKNIHEVDWQNLLFDPNARVMTTGPDQREVINPALGFNGAKIPLRPYNPLNTRNPYTSIILVKNTEGKKGFSYNFTFGVEKSFKQGMEFSANYTYGSSVVRNEATSSINSSNWNNMESFNGRNRLNLTRSDFDLGHRITSYISKKFNYANEKMATTVTLFYTGQSGSPFSYTMTSSMEGDGVNFNDLMYVPTKEELSQMRFLNNTIGQTTYTADQQRALFDAYIESDKYLSKTRGSHAERNGARLPFTHVLDLDIKQDFNFKIGKERYQFQIVYTVANFTNLLNKNWGRQYFVSFDQVNILQFAGYASGTTTPQYRFSPVSGPANGKPFTISDGITPFNSSRWTSQLTFRFNF